MVRREPGQRGFTLMEMMVVIVIVAILVPMAVPLYLNYVKDAQRNEARTAIGAIITGQQTYYQRFGFYAADLSSIPVDLGDIPNHWKFTLPEVTESSFTVTATGVAGNVSGQKLSCVVARGRHPTWIED